MVFELWLFHLQLQFLDIAIPLENKYLFDNHRVSLVYVRTSTKDFESVLIYQQRINA